MKTFAREIIFGSILLVIFIGLIIWMALSGSQSFLPIGIAILIVLVGAVTFITQTIRKKRNLETGAPPEDEFTKLAKVYAGNQAFLYSQYLWYLIEAGVISL